MEVSIKFTYEELRLIARGLTYGIIHTGSNNESDKMKELEQKIHALMGLAVTPK